MSVSIFSLRQLSDPARIFTASINLRCAAMRSCGEHHIIIAAQRKLLEAVNILSGSDSRRSESIETLIVRVTQMIEIFRQLQKF